MTPQRIYFDPEDHARDGHGWNVLDRDRDCAIVDRQATFALAVQAAAYWGGWKL